MSGPTHWWERPYRTFQTNLREIDAVLDERRVVQRIVELGASAWLLNTAGIVSFYPSQLSFQHPSPWLRNARAATSSATRCARPTPTRCV